MGEARRRGTYAQRVHRAKLKQQERAKAEQQERERIAARAKAHREKLLKAAGIDIDVTE